MISNCTISGSSCLIWQIGAHVANLPYHIFFNFLFIENRSGRSLSIIKRMYSTRGIRIWSEITCALLTIQLWWCLDRAHHRNSICIGVCRELQYYYVEILLQNLYLYYTETGFIVEFIHNQETVLLFWSDC